MDHKTIELLAEQALDTACATIQKALEVTTGDLAGVIFSDNTVKNSFIAYINAEINSRPQLVEVVAPKVKPESLVIEILRPSDNMTEVERANINSLFIAFGDSVTEVEVQYHGSGDCGGIEDVNVNGTLNQLAMMHLIVKHHDHDEVISVSIENAIRDVCNDLIDRRHGGFENNEGGGGTITFDAVEKTVQIDHFDNIVEEQYDYETLML